MKSKPRGQHTRNWPGQQYCSMECFGAIHLASLELISCYTFRMYYGDALILFNLHIRLELGPNIEGKPDWSKVLC